ncbi:uncharacterized protein LOC120632909 [Pararge aegeria]|uniref:uncharacterized protein LOC120632909 n=1 Tax=Pararge aegeria TaxID=116150 RepID=UPI0019CF4FA2|nr:uncharacterized protein LOC120632909 [Pararge aegeria]
MQRALRLIERWCKENDLSVNPKKTQLVLFTNKRKPDIPKLPTLFNTSLTLSNEVKYLGVTLDSKLSWKRHIEDKTNKATIILHQCKRMLGKTWGLKPKIMNWLYLAVVRSTLAYAALIWWPRTELITTQQELQKFQRQACLAITGGMSTTPTTALETILGIPPLHLYIKKEATLAALRLRTSGLWKNTNTAHTKILEEAYKRQPQLEWKCDRTSKRYILDRQYKINLEKEQSSKTEQNTIEVYTDGSKSKTGTGSGIVCPELNMSISYPLGKNNSVFQAECVGITTAAIAMTNRKVMNNKIIINSDSQTVLRSLASSSTTSNLIYDCHNALETLAAYNDITLRWVKGHDGNPDNEAADSLARQATTLKVVGPEPIVPIPFSDYKTWLHEQTQREHSQLWANAKDSVEVKIDDTSCKDNRNCRKKTSQYPLVATSVQPLIRNK